MIKAGSPWRPRLFFVDVDSSELYQMGFSAALAVLRFGLGVSASLQPTVEIHVDTGIENGRGQPWGIDIGPEGSGNAIATVTLENTSDSHLGIGYVNFEFEGDLGLEYAWRFGGAFLDQGWFEDLQDPNNPILVWGPYGSPAQIPAGGSILLGELTLSIDAESPFGSTFDFRFHTDPEAVFADDDIFRFLPTLGLVQTFTVIPEPKTHVLLLIGGLPLVRWR